MDLQPKGNITEAYLAFILSTSSHVDLSIMDVRDTLICFNCLYVLS